jgi:transcription initiation factor IIE alpha subunit
MVLCTGGLKYEHPLIAHNEFHCPLCGALEDHDESIEELEEAGKELASMEWKLSELQAEAK